MVNKNRSAARIALYHAPANINTNVVAKQNAVTHNMAKLLFRLAGMDFFTFNDELHRLFGQVFQGCIEDLSRTCCDNCTNLVVIVVKELLILEKVLLKDSLSSMMITSINAIILSTRFKAIIEVPRMDMSFGVTSFAEKEVILAIHL